MRDLRLANEAQNTFKYERYDKYGETAVEKLGQIGRGFFDVMNNLV